VIGTPEEIEGANSDDPGTARKALEKLLEKNPRSAMLLARLGASFRTDDPRRSLEFYRRAATLEPASAEYLVAMQRRSFKLVAFRRQLRSYDTQ